MNIFIVEDDELLLLMLDKMVNRMGFNLVGTATSGSEAIKAINKTNPDLILMDIQLKDNIDGIEVAKTVKEIYPYPIIYITGNSDLSIQEKADKYGFHDYLIKPTSYEILHKSILKLNDK
jgi:response regulator of citrate/malate metabolism